MNVWFCSVNTRTRVRAHMHTFLHSRLSLIRWQKQLRSRAGTCVMYVLESKYILIHCVCIILTLNCVFLCNNKPNEKVWCERGLEIFHQLCSSEELLSRFSWLLCMFWFSGTSFVGSVSAYSSTLLQQQQAAVYSKQAPIIPLQCAQPV